MTFDTRDHDMNPSAGLLVDLRANFADEAFGSDFTYQTYEFGGNTTAAPARASLRARLRLPGVGPHAALRPVPVRREQRPARLRGRALPRPRHVAPQAEYRFPLAGRWGGVVFGGWGKVARSFGDMGDEPDLPSIGAGVRWLAAEKARVNLSVDVARGRDGGSVYVYVKESF